MERKRYKKGNAERTGWQEALMWQSKSSYTEQRRLCTHEETEKPEKGETTGNGFTGTRPYSIDNGGTLQS
ncbi:hypothetical protein LSAT2_001462 [Lamellibrachia satsuma]|nr:hypothetical protein LSAT2_001462 [Lamellibrachia satsuma]